MGTVKKFLANENHSDCIVETVKTFLANEIDSFSTVSAVGMVCCSGSKYEPGESKYKPGEDFKFENNNNMKLL